MTNWCGTQKGLCTGTRSPERFQHFRIARSLSPASIAIDKRDLWSSGATGATR